MHTAKMAFAILCVAFGTLFLSGCNNDEPKETPTTQQPPAPTRTEKIELVEEGRPEQSIRHVYDELDREVERHVTYRDGDIESITYRTNGTAAEYVRKTKSGKVKARKVFGPDGVTVVEGKGTRSDGTDLWTIERQPDGTTKKTTYWYDGKRVFSAEVRHKDGSFETTYYRKSGSVSGKKRGTGDKINVEEFFDTSGTQTQRVDHNGDGTRTVTMYREGKAYGRQHWKDEKTSWGTNPKLLSVEELDAQGKVTRRLNGSSSWDLTSSETFNADGSRVVRTMRPDGYIGKEETFDASGKSTSVKEYGPNEYQREPYEWQLFRRDATPDLENGWKMQEDSPWYRDWRDE